MEEVAILDEATLLSGCDIPPISSPVFPVFRPMMSLNLRRAGSLVLVLVAGVLRAEPFDLVIRGARVIDGTGAPWIYADVAVKDGRIVHLGRLGKDVRGTRDVDAAGLYLAPGFIDPHSHAGPALGRGALAGAEPLLTQGITTVFINPDGGGPVDLAAQRRRLEQQRPAVHVAQLIGHNSIRTEVMGLADREPTPDELERMKALVRVAMEQGAFGLSAGPFYTPGNFSKTSEHVVLAEVAAGFEGVYQSHIRDEGDYSIGLVAAVEEVITVSRSARLPGIVTHIKALGPRVWGQSTEVVRRIDRARSEGVEVFADQYPYEASSTSLSAALLPPWSMEGGVGALQKRLADREALPLIRTAMLENLERRGGPNAIQLRNHREDTTVEGKRLDEVARARGVEPVDAAIALIRAGGADIVSFNMHEDDIRRFMVQPWTMTCSDGDLVAVGDGVPHPRSYGPFPRKLRRYAVDTPLLTLERAVHSMTGLTATVMRVRDRGVIRPGAWADLVLFDLATLADRATYENPHQLSTGMRHVFVNGVEALTAGRVTDLRAGRVLSRLSAP